MSLIKKLFVSIVFITIAIPVFAQDSGYFIGDGASGKRVLVYTSTIENGKDDDAWIAQKVKRDIISDFVNYSNIDVIDSDEKATILKLQKDSESAYYNDVNPIELGKAISAKSYIKIVSTKKKDTFSVTVTVTNIETGKTENSYTSNFYPENEFITKVHGEASADLLEKMGVKLTTAGKRLLQYGSFTQSSTESAENLETYKAEIARLEKEQSELMKNRNTEVDAEAQAARIETQKQMLLQQQKNEEERLARLREDEKRKAEEERLSKERSAESQKRIVELSKEIEEKAAKIREKKLEGMTVLQQIDVIEGEKQVLFQNEQTISQNIAAFNAEQDKLCEKEIEERRQQKPRLSEMNADGSLNDKGRAILESDIEAINLKYAKIKADNEQQVKDSAGKLQETLRKKIIDDINLLESKSYTADSLREESVYFRVGNYNGSAKSEGWNYNISFVFAGKTIYHSEGVLSYKNITSLDVPNYPNASDPKREQKIKAYNDYQESVEVYDSFFRMNVPYIRTVLTYSVKADDVRKASQYTVFIDKIDFIDVQTGKILKTTTDAGASLFTYIPRTLINWSLAKNEIENDIIIIKSNNVANYIRNLNSLPEELTIVGNVSSDWENIRSAILEKNPILSFSLVGTPYGYDNILKIGCYAEIEWATYDGSDGRYFDELVNNKYYRHNTYEFLPEVLQERIFRLLKKKNKQPFSLDLSQIEEIEILRAGDFSDFYLLTEITIPNTITKIEAGAFSNCCCLSSVIFLGTKKQWEKIVVKDSTLKKAKVKFLKKR